MRRHTCGFTLIEMLVALVLVVLMSLGMLEAFRFSQRALMQVSSVDAATHEVATAQRQLRRILEQTYPFEPPGGDSVGAAAQGFLGSENSIEFSAPEPATDGSMGLSRYKVTLVGGDAADLIVCWTRDRNGSSASNREALATKEAILKGIHSVSIEYMELIEHTNGEIEPHWKNSWIDNFSPPALIRVKVTFASGDKRRWPDLIVAPRLTTDANCVFDVVSQTCRVST